MMWFCNLTDVPHAFFASHHPGSAFDQRGLVLSGSGVSSPAVAVHGPVALAKRLFHALAGGDLCLHAWVDGTHFLQHDGLVDVWQRTGTHLGATPVHAVLAGQRADCRCVSVADFDAGRLGQSDGGRIRWPVRPAAGLRDDVPQPNDHAFVPPHPDEGQGVCGGVRWVGVVSGCDS